MGLLQRPGTHVARAVRMEHGGGTKPWLRIPEFWETHAQGQAWEIPVRDQMDPNLGSRPSSQRDKFHFQRIPEKYFMGFIFVIVWVSGLCWSSILLFF